MHVRLIVVSLVITDRLTAFCQGKGSRLHLCHCSNTIEQENVAIQSARVKHISAMNEIEQVPERFHGRTACAIAFNRSCSPDLHERDTFICLSQKRFASAMS